MYLDDILRQRAQRSANIEYVHELPFDARKQLCALLDESHRYEELAEKYMGFSQLEVEELRQSVRWGNSPSDLLLRRWSLGNHSILELFDLLRRMRCYVAMVPLRPFVHPRYHGLISQQSSTFDQNDDNANVRVEIQPMAETDRKLLNVPNASGMPNVNLLKPTSPLPNIRTQRSDISSVAESFAGVPQIAYEELQASTNNWDPQTSLGRGGFGSVFKATWKCTQVAVKRIEAKRDNPQEQIRQLITELAYLNTIRHDNVLPLYGFSCGGAFPCLVYQYMPGGSLESRLHTRDPEKMLPWTKRHDIAVGAARGLQYLHNVAGTPVIHGDIKSANILLDQSDNPRIGDFGLAREGPANRANTHITVDRPQGTRPYLPVEFLRNKKFSTKVDTYSFGIVLFEIATALWAYNKNQKVKLLRDHVVLHDGDILELKDVRMPGGEDIFQGLVEIGKLCVEDDPKRRPEMVTVLLKLEEDIVREF